MAHHKLAAVIIDISFAEKRKSEVSLGIAVAFFGGGGGEGGKSKLRKQKGTFNPNQWKCPLLTVQGLCPAQLLS